MRAPPSGKLISLYTNQHCFSKPEHDSNLYITINMKTNHQNHQNQQIVQSKHACFCSVIAWSGKIIFFISIIENIPILVSTSQGLPQDPFGGILRGIQSQQGLIGAINNFRQAIVSNPLASEEDSEE